MQNNKALSLTVFIPFVLFVLFALSVLWACPPQAHGGSLFSKDPENLPELAARVAGDLEESFRDTTGGAAPERKPLLIVGKNYFMDPQTEHIHPFSAYFADNLRTALNATGFFDAAAEGDAESLFAVSGTYYKEKDRLIVNCTVKTTEAKTGNIVPGASASTSMPLSRCMEEWFRPSVQSKVRYLMTRIETKSFDRIYFKKRRDVSVEKFTFGTGEDYPEMSVYIADYLTEFLSGSRLLVPKRNRGGVAVNPNRAKNRDIMVVPVESDGASLASFAGAAHALVGNYRMADGDTLEIYAELAEAGRPDVLGAATVRLPLSLVNADWLKSGTVPDEAFENAYEVFSQGTTAAQAPFTVKIVATHGRRGAVYRQGEPIVFVAAVSMNAYLRIYNRGVSGQIVQLYPNVFSGPERKVQAGEQIVLPTEGTPFEFLPSPPFGREIVKAYASDKPLNDLPSEDLGGYKRILPSATEIQAAHERHASENGIAMAQDKMVLFTAE